jgi:2-methylisocitrate lyase-like PEP mutase family enzyme
MPNPWDVGSAVQLEEAGFAALATTSSGFAKSLGRSDGETTLFELAAHVAAICEATTIPLNVDAERCFSESVSGIGDTVRMLADSGAAGFSIEDWSPETGIDPLPQAAQRVAAAVAAASDSGMVVTARAENLLRGVDDLDDTIARLTTYADAGAHCVYAPGLHRPDDIAAVVQAADGLAVNVLLWPNGPTVPQLAELGVRRVSVGGSLANAAYKAAMDAAAALQP